MTGRSRPTIHPLAALAGLVTLVTGLLLLTAGPAAAHAELAETSPANGAHLDRAPGEVLLRFTEAVRPVRDGLRLVDGDGRTVLRTSGETGPDGATQVRMTLPDSLPDSAYVVVWRVLSADSHPVHGAFVFSVGSAQAAPLADPGARAGADEAVGVLFWVTRLLGFAGLALLVGGTFFVLVCWPAGREDPRARRLLRAAWLTTVLGALVTLLLQGPNAVGSSLVTALDPALLADTVGTTFGVALLARLALLAVAGGVLAWLFRPSNGVSSSTTITGDGGTWRHTIAGRAWPLAALACALALTWSATGHAAAGTLAALAAALDAVHLLAMSVWLGGLALLVGCTLRWRERRAPEGAVVAVSRFSRLAVAAVVTLGATGLLQAWRELAEYGVGTRYFSILVFKVSAFGLLLWLGAVSRSVVHRRLAARAGAGQVTAASTATTATTASTAGTTSAARTARTTSTARITGTAGTAGTARTVSAVRGAPAPRRRENAAATRAEQDTLTGLRRTVQWEAAIAAVVLAITAALVATPPGGRDLGPQAAAAEAPAGPFLGSVRLSGAGDVQVWMDPARRGSNQIVLNVRDAQGINRDVPEVRAELRMDGGSVGPLPVTLVRKAPGQFVADGVLVPSAGIWQLDLRVRTTDFDEESVLARIPIRS